MRLGLRVFMVAAAVAGLQACSDQQGGRLLGRAVAVDDTKWVAVPTALRNGACAIARDRATGDTLVTAARLEGSLQIDSLPVRRGRKGSLTLALRAFRSSGSDVVIVGCLVPRSAPSALVTAALAEVARRDGPSAASLVEVGIRGFASSNALAGVRAHLHSVLASSGKGGAKLIPISRAAIVAANAESTSPTRRGRAGQGRVASDLGTAYLAHYYVWGLQTIWAFDPTELIFLDRYDNLSFGSVAYVINWDGVDACASQLNLINAAGEQADAALSEFAIDSVNLDRLGAENNSCERPLFDSRKWCLDFWIIAEFALHLLGDNRIINVDALPNMSRAQIEFDLDHPDSIPRAFISGSRSFFDPDRVIPPLPVEPAQFNLTRVGPDSLRMHVRLMTSACKPIPPLLCGEIDNTFLFVRDPNAPEGWSVEISGNAFPSVAFMKFTNAGWVGSYIQIEPGGPLAPLGLLRVKLGNSLDAVGGALNEALSHIGQIRPCLDQ